MTLDVLVLVILFCWSIWGVFDKKAIDSSNYLDVLLMLHLLLLCQIPLLVVLCNIFAPGWHLGDQVLFWSFLGSMSASLGTFAYLVAMGKAEASYVLGITAAYPLVMQVLAYFMLSEQIVANRMIGSILIGFGVGAIGWSGNTQVMENSSTRDKWIIGISCFTACLCWGIFGLFDKKAVSYGAPLEVFLARTIWEVIIVALVVIGFRIIKHKADLKNKRAWLFCGLSSLCLAAGSLCTLAAMSISSASYVLVITGCYPLLTYVFALIFLKEKMNRMRLFGILLLVAGGLLVQFTQGK